MGDRHRRGKRRTAGWPCGPPGLATAPGADPAGARETLADCALRAFTRYNGDHNPMSTPGTPTDEVRRPPKIKIATRKPQNPRVSSARVRWEHLKVAVRRSAKDDNQKL